MGIITRVNANNWYQKYDTDSERFIGEPIRPYEVEENFGLVASSNTESETSIIAQGSSIVDQIEHQTILTEDGRTIDLDQKHFNIVDENGRIEFDADGLVIASIAKEKLTYGNFIRTYRESSREAMFLLLALQSNATPLKRGGIDIAYMTDILVDHMIVQFSEEANTLWEALSALQSSKPEDSYFRLTADDLKPYTNYKSDEALYNAFKKGAEELKKTNLEFDIPDPDRDGHNIMIHWNDGAEWVGNNKRTGEKAHFDVYTNDFYRVLMSSSGILHGTHWNRKISRSLKGYARALYMFCARNKGYTKYKGAIPGVKELSVEEARYELKVDANTEARGIWRRLKEAQEKVNNLPDSEFSVNVKRVPETGKIQGFRFEIKENRFIDVKARVIDEDNLIESQSISENIDKELYSEIKMLCAISKLDFNDNEISRITACAKRNNKDGQYMMQVFSSYKQRLDNESLDPIEDSIGYICRIIEQGTSVKVSSKAEKNSFNNFQQRQYTAEQLNDIMFNKKN
ncbi:Initiator Replication protein [Pseudobutyrivibrio sp. YE44]|uniref:replication initiation protein n=1 Tax=Pseudobutyrivibrio sp. YE44 TaxID=1520802 RepID=UPI0008901BC2|nr:replication initiation protein [Pseudobutyrivibrio sp. YE44]SDB55427.1 Initiator Replication protein [Pseudobutyrivibrio sp. YE44]